jgi:site-specific recombinase XerD
LVPHIDAFLALLHGEGYTRRVIGSNAQVIAKFSRWLKASHIHLADLTDEHAERFLARLAQKSRSSRGYCGAIRRFVGFLRTLGVIGERVLFPEPTPVQVILATYARYLSHDRALSRATSIQYLPFAECFLQDRFGADSPDLSALSAVDVIGFIRRQAARLGQARAKCATIALRSFLRYLRYRGEIILDLAAAVPTVPNWSMTGIPRAISGEHVRATLASCRRDEPVGCRDYAILLLLARLGLRSGEIVSLTLDSIDWPSGSITVQGSKGGQLSQLPLPSDVGEAIADYLQNGRPRSSGRTLFLRAVAPVRGLGSSTSIGTIVRGSHTRRSRNTP